MENDGNGNYSKKRAEHIPESAPKSLSATEYDNDGDLDISLIEGPLLFSFVTKDYIKKCIENENLPIDDEPVEEAPDSLNDVKKDKIANVLNIDEDDDDDYPEEECYEDDEKRRNEE